MSAENIESPDQVETNRTAADITLLEGEQVLENVRPSWVNWWAVLLVAVLLGLIGLAIVVGGDAGGVLPLVIGALLFGYVRYARERSRYIVTNQRVKKRVGLARRATGETRITKIRGMSTEQSLFERLIGKGSVLIDSGAASGKLGIRGVGNHEQLANTIREQQRRIEQGE